MQHSGTRDAVERSHRAARVRLQHADGVCGSPSGDLLTERQMPLTRSFGSIGSTHQIGAARVGNETLAEEGMAVRREVLGDDYVDRAISSTNSFNRDLQSLVQSYCWGAVWTRNGLDRKTRSLINLGMLTALNRNVELEAHVRGAVNNGCTAAEISEVFLQAAIYCGIPAALDASRVAEKVVQAKVRASLDPDSKDAP